MSDNPFLRVPGPDPMRLTPQEHLALARAPRLAPEKQWWNFSAKKAAGERIADEELDRSKRLARQAGLEGAGNNEFDAMRHARWSQRMSTEIDPIFSRLAGAEHEVVGSLPSSETLARYGAPNWLRNMAEEGGWHSQPESEAFMDRRNNAEGRLAAAQGRAIDPANLQSHLDSPPAGASSYPRARPRGGGPGRI